MTRQPIIGFIFLLGLLLLFCFMHVTAGTIKIDLFQGLEGLVHYDAENTHHIIFNQFRIPRLTMALLAGSALSLAGMLMQTLFNNPLAGPYVLGINSGSSLFVAISLMTGVSCFQSDFGLIGSALLGAFAFGCLILACSFFLSNQISLLLVGLMIGSFTGAFVSMLESSSSDNQLKAFTMWTMGSLQQVETVQIPLIVFIFTLAVLFCFLLIKPLNAMTLGENAMQTLGFNLRQLRFIIISVTALLAGLITAFCGPIAFVGLAVPNLSRMVFKTQSHGILMCANLLIGSLFLVISDTIIQWFEPYFFIPINAFTSLLGAPLVIFILFRRHR